MNQAKTISEPCPTPKKTISKKRKEIAFSVFLDLSQIPILLEIYKVRFQENNIKVHLAKPIGKEFHLELGFEKQLFCLMITENQIFPKRFHMNDIQISRLISNSNPSDMFEFFEKLFLFLPLLQKYCISCQKILDVSSNQYISCGDLECAYKMEELPLNPCELVEIIQKNKEISTFLLYQANLAGNSERNINIFEPYPFFMLDQDIKNPIKRGEMSVLMSSGSSEKVNQMKNMEKIKKIIGEYKNFIIKSEKYKLDEEIIKDFGLEFYKLVKFIMQSNKTRIEKEMDSNHYSIFKMTHEMDIEQKMKENTSNVLLFHGSPAENWYSIIRNGLKITSHTKLMSNGAAHGSGLYFSNEAGLSYTYCKQKKGETAFIGVYQLYDDLNKYKKTNNIYVVNDPKIVLLRYLICIESPLDVKTLSQITEYFNKSIKANQKINAKVNARGVTKLIKELSEISKKNESELGFEVKTDEDDIYKWYIYFRDFDEKTMIYKDMKKFKIPEIKIEMIFPLDYPFQPPFIHIMNPRFQYQTGHITSEGAICMELLTPSGWTPVQNIESLLIQIKALIIEGDGRIDEKRWKEFYTLQEAKKSFERVARGHGWLK